MICGAKSNIRPDRQMIGRILRACPVFGASVEQLDPRTQGKAIQTRQRPCAV